MFCLVCACMHEYTVCFPQEDWQADPNWEGVPSTDGIGSSGFGLLGLSLAHSWTN